MSVAIFSQALREYLRPRRSLSWILLALLCLALSAGWKGLDPKASALDQYATVSSILVFRLMALASAVFTTAILTQEVEQRTIVYLLTRPVPRWQLLLVRYAASVVAVAAVGILAALLASVGAYGANFAANPLLAKDILALGVGAVAYGALFLLVSLLFNRSLMICSLFAFGWESSAPSLPGDLFRLSIYSYLQAIARHPTSGGNGLMERLGGSAAINAISQVQAFTILGSMTLALLALSAWWFTHFEYIPRDDVV